MDEDMKSLLKAKDIAELKLVPNIYMYTTFDDVQLPVYALDGFEDLANIRKHGKTLAEKGVVANLHSQVIQQAREIYGSQALKHALRPMTAHNDKLGANWRFNKGDGEPGYVLDQTSSHYASTYSVFAKEAATFWANTSYATHLNGLDATFGRLQVPAQQQFITDRAALNSMKPSVRRIGRQTPYNKTGQELWNTEQNSEYDERTPHKTSMMGTKHIIEMADIKQQLDNREKEILELQSLVEMDKESIKVDPRHLKGAFMDLPRLLRKAAEQGSLNWEQKYLQSMIDPFSAKSDGVRVPNLMDDSTIATFDLQTFQFTAAANGRAMLVINYDAVRTGPYCFVNGPLKDFNTSLAQNLVVKVPGSADETINTVGYNSGMTSTQWQQNAQYGKAIENRDVYNSLRVVAGGFRIYETTARENRGGIVRAAYAHRGLQTKGSLKKAVEDNIPNKNAAKVYLSGGSGCCRGRSGFVLGGTYRPKDHQEVSQFSDAHNVFANEQQHAEFEDYEPAQAEVANHWLGNSVADNFHGPVVLFAGQNAGDDPSNMVITHDTFPGTADSEISISAKSLQRQHTVVVLFEQVEPGTSFEIEIIRRIEGIASEAGQAFEEQTATLGSDYATPFELLRRHEHEPILNPLQDEIFAMRGFFDWPLVQTVKDIMGFRLDADDDSAGTIGDWMARAAPALTRLVLGAVPGLNTVAGPIADALDQAIGGIRGMKGKNGKLQITQHAHDYEEEKEMGMKGRPKYRKGSPRQDGLSEQQAQLMCQLQSVLGKNQATKLDIVKLEDAIKSITGHSSYEDDNSDSDQMLDMITPLPTQSPDRAPEEIPDEQEEDEDELDG